KDRHYIASMEIAGDKNIIVFQNEDGNHWTETHKHRPVYQMERGDVFWFVLGHVILFPLALAVLILTALALPLYVLWAKVNQRRQPPVIFHPEAQHILETPGVNHAFS